MRGERPWNAAALGDMEAELEQGFGTEPKPVTCLAGEKLDTDNIAVSEGMPLSGAELKH